LSQPPLIIITIIAWPPPPRVESSSFSPILSPHINIDIGEHYYADYFHAITLASRRYASYARTPYWLIIAATFS